MRSNRNQSFFVLVVCVVLFLLGLFFWWWRESPQDRPVINTKQDSAEMMQNQPAALSENQSVAPADQQRKQSVIEPISHALGRVTKKPFGIYVMPKNSPVQPERFQGYHTGVDFEVSADEQNVDVPIVALCGGRLLMARSASGYGGAAVQSCTLEGQSVTVIYGHLRLTSMQARIGSELQAGDFLANLGTGFSSETDGERKHLHLGIHKGSAVNILGYVQRESELSIWDDPLGYLR